MIIPFISVQIPVAETGAQRPIQHGQRLGCTWYHAPGYVQKSVRHVAVITSKPSGGQAAVSAEGAALLEGGAPAVEQPKLQPQQGKQSFNWYKQWYPVALVEDLDPHVPSSVQLMGMNLVVWRDADGIWRAFKDSCPHRLAPLSEGRVDKDTGNLSCNYHGWQFDGQGQCTKIPQLTEGAEAPNPKRSCAKAFPTAVSEDLLWIWADSSPGAAKEAAAAVMPHNTITPHLGIAPELGMFGPAAFWSTRLGFEKDTFLGTWYQRFCNASYAEVKRNVFNDPSHDTVLHHDLGGLSRTAAAPAEVLAFHTDDKGFSINRLNKGSGRTVRDTCTFPSGTRRDFAGDPRFGAGVGYVTPTAPGRCNMIIGIVRYPQFAAKARGLEALLGPLLPFTPRWLQHITMHEVVDADIAMQAGINVNESLEHRSGGHAVGFMPAVGVDKGPIAVNTWLQTHGGGGPDAAMSGVTPAAAAEASGLPAGPGNIYPMPRELLLDRYQSHTKHCKACSAALANFKWLHAAAALLAQALAAAALSTAVAAAVLAAGLQGVSTAAAPLWQPAVLLGLGAALMAAVKAWSSKMIAKFVFVDYDHTHVSKT